MDTQDNPRTDNQHAEIQHAENQRLTIKNCLLNCPQKRDSRKKYNIQGDIRALLRKDCEMEKIIRFLKETEMFEEIYIKK